VSPEQAQSLAMRLVQFLETGQPPAGLFAADVFCDFTSPRWREQAQGVGALVELRRRGHPGAGRVPRFRCDPTPSGFVLELEETWVDQNGSWYCREMFRADVSAGAISSLSAYCTGDWDRDRRAEHARSVRLLRP
jgi:hypothetical protein